MRTIKHTVSLRTIGRRPDFARYFRSKFFLARLNLNILGRGGGTLLVDCVGLRGL